MLVRWCKAILAATLGAVLAFGTMTVVAPPAQAADLPFYGSLGGQRLNAPVVSMFRTARSAGYYMLAEDGGVFAFGDAVFRGSMGGTRLNGPIVGGTLAPSGAGYYMVGRDGGIFAFGNAPFRGSLGGLRLNGAITAMDAPAGVDGYVMLGADGGLFAFGTVPFFGSASGATGGVRAVDLAVLPDGRGYWILLEDGRVFAYGAAPALGSTPRLAARAVALEPAPDGRGYLVVSADGGAFAFGSARFHGSVAGARLNGPIVDAAVTDTGDGYWMLGSDGGVFGFPGPGLPPGGTPQLSVVPVVTGLTVPWDLAWLPEGALVFTERPGRIRAVVAGGAPRLLAAPSDVRAAGEGGMTGLAIDPDFAANRRIYTCFNTTAGDIKVVVWTIDAGITTATRIGTLVEGIPAAASGRHSGCRPRVGPDGSLWVGTGDAADGTVPQDENSLGGKVLRVDRFSGAAAPGNPGGRRWYTRGHRNVQGLAFRTDGQAYSFEHGPDRNDELNRLFAGANFGWNPVPGYNESRPMTESFGTPAIWSSGVPTIATSGATFLSGPQWKDWDGWLMTAALAGQQLRVFQLDGPGTGLVSQTVALRGWGRLRTPIQGPDGNVYVTTSNGTNDVILRVTPG